MLALQPATKGSGLHAPHSPSNTTSSWGGSVAYDANTKKWNMYAAEMVNHCGIGAWESNSRIVRATSDTAGGMYTVEEVIKPTFAHEPVLQHLADGRWALYSIGNASCASPPLTTCIGGYSPRLQAQPQPHGRLQQRQRPAPQQRRPAPLGFVGAIPVEVYLSKAGGGVGADAGWSRLPIDINPDPGTLRSERQPMQHAAHHPYRTAPCSRPTKQYATFTLIVQCSNHSNNPLGRLLLVVQTVYPRADYCLPYIDAFFIDKITRV